MVRQYSTPLAEPSAIPPTQEEWEQFLRESPDWRESDPEPMPEEHHGRWVLSLKQWTCEACGRAIFPGEYHLWFPWFPGREHSIACGLCASGGM